MDKHKHSAHHSAMVCAVLDENILRNLKIYLDKCYVPINEWRLPRRETYFAGSLLSTANF